jgi:uncharacterized protein (DUF885 family)
MPSLLDFETFPVGTVDILRGREMPLKPCPDLAVMTKALREKFEEVERLTAQEAWRRKEAWAMEDGIPALLAQEADDAAEAVRKGEPMPESKVEGVRQGVERLRAEATALAKAKRDALTEALEAGPAEFETAFGKADKGVGDAYDKAVKAGEEFDEAIAEMIRATAARSWVYSVLGSGVHPPRARLRAPATTATHPNGATISADEAVALALDALRAQIATREGGE